MCIHHWIISSDNVSRCKYCPATKKEVTASEILYPNLNHRVRICQAERIRRNEALKEVKQLRDMYYMMPTV